jgi:predicted metal-dependent phosphoesterase TrpH
VAKELGRADLHIHTTYKDGLSTVDEVIARAVALELDVIAITDHDTIEGAIEARKKTKNLDLEVIVGEEISSRAGHVIGLFLNEKIEPWLSLAETIRRIHRQGGLAIIPHPLWSLRGQVPIAKSRRIDLGMSGVSRRSMIKILRADPESRPDAVEVFNASPIGLVRHLEVKLLNQEQWHLPEVGSSDAHSAAIVGHCYTIFPGRSAANIRQAIEKGETIAEGSFMSPSEAFRLVRCRIRRDAGRLKRRGLESLKPREEWR